MSGSTSAAADDVSGFLTFQDIEQRWDDFFPEGEDGEKVPPISPDDANPASVDLHLGSSYDLTDLEAPGRLSEDAEYLTIRPGEFALLKTWEVVRVPLNVIGLITMRSTYKWQGLINVSGFHVDPGWQGHIIYSVYNAGPANVPLKWRDAVFTIFFATLAQDSHKEYAGDHKGSEKDLPGKLVRMMRHQTVNPVKLNQRLTALEGRVSQLMNLGVVLVGTILTVGLTIALTLALID